MDHVSAELSPDCRPAPLTSLLADVVPVGQHFIRSHFGTPSLSRDDYVLEVGGFVHRPLRWTLSDLRKLSHISTHVTLECAGHRRLELDPPAPGVPWGLGAISHARWAGGQLADLLDIVRPLPTATHMVLIGRDEGAVEGRAASEPFARAIPLRDPVIRQIVLAWEMNGRGLEPEHGAPVRAVVPGWFAVSSVKWLARIELISGPFAGYFQAVDYRVREDGEAGPGRELSVLPIHSLIVPPGAASSASGLVPITGLAWGGRGGVQSVEVQVADQPWRAARIDPGPGLHAPTRFSISLELAAGTHVVRSRATDRSGNQQPLHTPWNERGYCVSSVRAFEVAVT